MLKSELIDMLMEFDGDCEVFFDVTPPSAPKTKTTYNSIDEVAIMKEHNKENYFIVLSSEVPNNDTIPKIFSN